MFLSVFLLFVSAVGLEGLHVHGPPGPVVAQLGDSVLLPCFSENPLPLKDLQVEWRKMDSDSLVCIFQQGESRLDLQSHMFRGRVDMFPDEVSKGNFSVLLPNVVKEDAGVYRCLINATQDSGEVIMEIKDISYYMLTRAEQNIFAHEGEDVILNCSVDPHVPVSEIEEVTWKKTVRDQDIIALLYQDSEIFLDASHELYKGRVDLFSSEIPKGNFSLKLRDVQMEDKGEFVCEVHTGNMSARTIVVLQSVGLSAVPIVILVFCLVALLLAVGFCGPVYNLLRKKDTIQHAMKIHISLILCPNICMFVAFCLWSTEGFLSEVITCSTVNIMRPLILLKTSSYLDRLPKLLRKAVMDLAFPLYHSSLALGACLFFLGDRIQTSTAKLDAVLAVLAMAFIISAVVLALYGLRIQMIVCLELLNTILLAFCVRSKGNSLDLDYEMVMVIPSLNVGILMVLSLQRHLFLGKPFECVHIALSSILVTISSLYEICMYTSFSIKAKDFVRLWTFLFEAGLFILAWSGMIYLLRCHRRQKQGCCSHWRKIGYLCCTVIVAFLIATHGTMSFNYIYLIMDKKDRAGPLALTPLVQVLVAICFIKHPKVLPDFLHMMIYMFGAVGLSSVNAIALATELILKAEGGSRTIEDLRLIVLPFEMVFLFAWLTLQIYDAWMGFKDRTKQDFENERGANTVVVPEMEALSHPNPK